MRKDRRFQICSLRSKFSYFIFLSSLENCKPESKLRGSTSLPTIRDNPQYDLINFKQAVGAELTDKEALDLLFYCPFKFPSYQFPNK